MGNEEKSTASNQDQTAKDKKVKRKPGSGEESISQSRADRKKEFKQDALNNTSSRGVTHNRKVTPGRDRG